MPSDSLKAELTRRLLNATAEIPTSKLGRLGRTATTVFRSGRMIRKKSDDVDLEAVARIVSSIGELKGIAMKAGQLLSYVDISLPDDLRQALSVLQTHAQPMPADRVRDILREELGGAATELLADLEPVPIAAASIGQVHGARLADGQAVAVKVQYPDVARAIEADFGPAAAGTKMVRLIYPNAKVDSFLAEARARFMEECDYLHEAHCQARFAEIFASHPVLQVPAVVERLCARRVLTSELMSGEGFEAFLAREHSQEQRDVIGTAMFEFYVSTLFRHGLYNCDPHPGNYLFRQSGQVVMLDYGCTREFEPEFVARLARLTKAVHADERQLLHQSFLELGMVRQGKKYDFSTARGLVRAFYGPMLRDEEQRIDLGEAMSMRQVMASKRELMRLGIPGEFLFLFRIRFGLMSVLSRLGARANWYRLERGAALSADSSSESPAS